MSPKSLHHHFQKDFLLLVNCQRDLILKDMKVLGRNVLFSYSNMNSLCSFKSYNFRVLCLCWFSPKKDRNSLCISQPQQMSTVSYNLFISKCLSLKTKGLLIDLAIFLVILTVRSSEKFPFSSPSILCSKAEGMNMEHVF